METLEELIDWLKHGGGKVAIHDATNSTEERRRVVWDRIKKEKNMDVIFVGMYSFLFSFRVWVITLYLMTKKESICTDAKVLETNVRMKLKGPDYINMAPDAAMRDFLERTHNYERVYQTISDREEEAGMSYIKIMNVGRKIIAHGMHGFLPSQCVFYLMQIHIKPRVLWLTRHGESS